MWPRWKHASQIVKRVGRAEMEGFFEFMQRNGSQIAQLTLEHLWLGIATMLLATAIGVPRGILVTRKPWLSKPILGGANAAETIPSLALFGFLLPVPWLGARGDRLAIVALTLYAFVAP